MESVQQVLSGANLLQDWDNDPHVRRMPAAIRDRFRRLTKAISRSGGLVNDQKLIARIVGLQVSRMGPTWAWCRPMLFLDKSGRWQTNYRSLLGRWNTQRTDYQRRRADAFTRCKNSNENIKTAGIVFAKFSDYKDLNTKSNSANARNGLRPKSRPLRVFGDNEPNAAQLCKLAHCVIDDHPGLGQADLVDKLKWAASKVKYLYANSGVIARTLDRALYQHRDKAIRMRYERRSAAG